MEAIKMRSNKKVCLIAVVWLMAGLAVANTVWNPQDPNAAVNGYSNWNWTNGTLTNWTSGIPTMGTGANDGKAVVNNGAVAECRIDSMVGCKVFVMGDGTGAKPPVVRIVDGGTLYTQGGEWNAVGYSYTSTMIIEAGGTFNSGSRLGVGWFGTQAEPSKLLVDGGHVIVNGTFQVGTDGGPQPNHDAYIRVTNRGLIEVNGPLTFLTGEGSIIDVGFGKIVFNSNVKAQLDTLIASNEIKGFGGKSTPTAVWSNGVTTLTAPDPLNRVPAMDAVVPTGDVNLSWVNVGTPPVYIAVWFGTDPANLTRVTDPNTAIDITTVTVNAPVFDEYIWRVDTFDSPPGTDPNDPIVGDTMYFVASNDSPPSIIMNTPTTMTWKNQPTTLQATVYDDGKSPVTVTWSAADLNPAGPITDPNVIFNPPSTVIPAQASYAGTGIVVATTMTVDYHAAQMTVTATAQDSNPLLETASGSVNLDCADNPCQAARVIGYGAAHPGDIAVNCLVNLEDFAEVARQWLTNYTLTGPIPVP